MQIQHLRKLYTYGIQFLEIEISELKSTLLGDLDNLQRKLLSQRLRELEYDLDELMFYQNEFK